MKYLAFLRNCISETAFTEVFNKTSWQDEKFNMLKARYVPRQIFSKKKMQKIPKLVRLGSRCINFSVLDNESFINLF